MYFDARAAKLMKPGGHLVIEGCPGLRLVCTVAHKTWTYRYKAIADGRMKQVAIGRWPAMPVQTAAAQWQVLRDQRAAGADPSLTRKTERQAMRAAPGLGVMTVRRVVDDFSERLPETRQAAGALAAQRQLERLLQEEPGLAAQDAVAVTRADAFRLLEARRNVPTTTAKLRGLLASAWDRALDAGDLPTDTPNWWRLVLRGGLKSKGKTLGGKHIGRQRRVLAPAEIAALLDWSVNMHEVGRDALVLYLWTCTRGVEIFGMRPEQLHEEVGGILWWQIPKMQTKNARHEDAVDLRVPLFGRALEVVKRRLSEVGKSGWLFEGEGGEQYRQTFFSTYVYNLQPYSTKVTGRQGGGLVLPVTHWSPHNLRRTARTALASLGCPNEVGEAIVGHMPDDMVATYNAYSYDAERHKWLAKLAAYMEGLGSGLPARPKRVPGGGGRSDAGRDSP
ncbi:MAG: integrase arm-type DNA-binding domain-containing protein [Pseudomonadota bacterium]